MDLIGYDLVTSDAEIKLRLDVLSPKRLTIVYVTGLSLFLSCVLIALFSPPMFAHLTGDVTKCDDSKPLTDEEWFSFGCIPTHTAKQPKWIGELQDISPMNQFFIISADVFRSEEFTVLAIDLELLLTVTLVGVNESVETAELLHSQAKTYKVTCAVSEAYCGSLFLGYEPHLDYRNYDIGIEFGNWEKIGRWIQSIQVNVRAVRTEFSAYQVTVKSCFLCLSLIGFFTYMYQILRANVEHWTTETRGLVLLSCSTVLFNDPLFQLTLTHPSFTLTVLSVFCVLQFIVILAYFWADILLEIRPVSKPSSLRLALAVYLTVLLMSLMIVYLYTALLWKNDPSYRLAEFPVGLRVLAGLSIVMSVVYLLGLGVLTIRAIPAIRNQTNRLKFLCLVNLLMAAFTVICVASGFFQRLPSLGPFVLIVISAYNIYVCVLEVLLAPTKQRAVSKRQETELQSAK